MLSVNSNELYMYNEEENFTHGQNKFYGVSYGIQMFIFDRNDIVFMVLLAGCI